MKNDVILAKVAEKLPVSSLLDLRRTGHSWSSNFLPELKQKHGKILVRVGSRRFFNDCKLEDRKGIKKLSKIMESSDDFPFAGFRVFIHDEIFQRDNFMKFATSFGGNISSLELIWNPARYLELDELKTLIFDLCPNLNELDMAFHRLNPNFGQLSNFSNRISAEPGAESNQLSTPQTLKLLPKLKRFAVAVDFECDSAANPVFTQFIFDVIQNANRLEKLKLLDTTDGRSSASATAPGNDFMGPMIHRLPDIPQLNQLKILNLPLVLKVAEVKILYQLGRRKVGHPVKLVSFSTRATSTVPPEGAVAAKECFRLLHDFLVTQSPTMRKLKLHFKTENGEDEADPNVCYIPRMEKLDKFTVTNSTFRLDKLQFSRQAQTFMETFPALRQFSYQYYKFSGFMPVNTDNVDRLTHSGVTHFKLKTYIDDYKIIRDFGPVFPSLTILELLFTPKFTHTRSEVHVYAHELAIVWTIWPGLTKLKIGIPIKRLSLDLDEFISGVPRSELIRLEHQQRQQMDVPLTLNSLRRTINHCKLRPGISDLKYLQEFTITFSDSEESNPQLTDMGGYFGVALASPTLQRLVIQGDEKNWVSEDCLTFIANTFGPLAEIRI